MLQPFITGFLLMLCFTSFAQTKEKDAHLVSELGSKFAASIDSTRILSGNSKLTYSHDSLFKCIHLTGPNGQVSLIDVRYLGNHRGYVKFKADQEDYVLFDYRGDGSGNPAFLMKVNKRTGTKEFPTTDDL